jgi:hypothetical protein
MQRATSPGTQKPIITCGICFGILAEPVTFGCTHSFCSRCVRAKLDKAGMGDGYPCSLCNVHHPNVSVRNLADFADNDLTDRIQRISRGDESRPMCQWCEESPAALFCPDCQYTLCTECNIAVHKNAAKRSHAPQAISDNRVIRSVTRKCPVKGHEEYKLELYCTRCEALCCAYCLQIAPHRGHESVLVTKAAVEVRQRMGRDLEDLGQVKARIEAMANELNRIHGQYYETYDHVESLVTDRFNAFRHQLVQREVEVRKILQNLRDVGDASLAESRAAYLLKLNSINEAGITFRRLQHGGADFEVLQNRATMSAFLHMNVPSVSGTGFRLSDLGDLNLSGLTISLDLHSTDAGAGVQLPPQPSTMNDSAAKVVRGGPQLAAQPSAASANPLPPQAPRLGEDGPRPPRFTFKPDPDVDITPAADGTALKCSERTPNQVGVHARETFEVLKPVWRQEQGRLSWRVRLDRLREGFIGVVETDTGRSGQPEGFHWQPMIAGSYEGTVGKPTHVCKALPACKPKDVVTFTYDTSSNSLSLAINNADRGTLVTNMHTRLAPCFILPPGEGVTLLN